MSYNILLARTKSIVPMSGSLTWGRRKINSTNLVFSKETQVEFLKELVVLRNLTG